MKRVKDEQVAAILGIAFVILQRVTERRWTIELKSISAGNEKEFNYFLSMHSLEKATTILVRCAK